MGFIELLFGIIGFLMMVGVAKNMYKRKKYLGSARIRRKPQEMGAHGVFGE